MFKIRDKKLLWCYLCVYLLLLFKAGFMFIAQYSAITSLILLFLLIVILSPKTIDNRSVGVMMALMVCTVITGFIEGFSEASDVILFYVNLITALFLSASMSKRQFFNIYSDIIFVICSANLFFHVLLILGVPLIRLFPVITNTQGVQAHFAILTDYYSSHVEGSGGITRLFGIFWEPGAFQALIVIAFCIELFREREKRIQNIYLIVFIITIILTYSTTGFICLVFLLALLLNKRFKTKLLPTMVFVAIVIFFYNYFSTRLDGYLYHATYGKIDMLVNSDAYGETASTAARSQSIIYGIQLFLNSPIWGIGQAGQEWMANKVGHTMMTCTPVNYFAYYGLLCGVLSFWGFIKCMHLNGKTLAQGLLLVSVLIITTSSENFAFNPILTTFMFYGYQKQLPE